MADIHVCSHGKTVPCDECQLANMLALRKELDPDAPDAIVLKEDREQYFGHNCPQGMVQIEFVGCDPKTRYSNYGYKPSKTAFIEIYVDGVRFRVDVGDVYNGSGSKKVRGIHINGPIDLQVEKTATNAVSVFIPANRDVGSANETETNNSRLAQQCDAG